MSEIETKKGRVVDVVLKQIVKIIPDSETELLKELRKFESTLGYCAPEVQRGADCWIPLIGILNFYIPIKEEEWHLKIRDILNPK
jgi:hypothetical protein